MKCNYNVTMRLGRYRHYSLDEYPYYEKPAEYVLIQREADNCFALLDKDFESQSEAEKYYESLNLEDFQLPKPGIKVKYHRDEWYIWKELQKQEPKEKWKNSETLKYEERKYNEDIDK